MLWSEIELVILGGMDVGGGRKGLWLREKGGFAGELLDMLWIVAGVLGELLGCADDDDLLRGHGEKDLLIDDNGGRERVEWLHGRKVHMMVDMLLLWDWFWLYGFGLGDIDEGYLWGLYCFHWLLHEGVMRLF